MSSGIEARKRGWWCLAVIPALISACEAERAPGDEATVRVATQELTLEETEKLVALVPVEDAAFGTMVAIAGDVVAVSAPGDTVDGVVKAGAVYVYRQTGGGLAFEERIEPIEPAANERFGQWMVTDGKVIVIGNLAGNRAYIYRKDGAFWQEVDRLSPPAGSTFLSAAVSGDSLAFGAFTATNGVVHVYRFDGLEWSLEQENLIGKDTVGGDFFGFSLAIDGDVMVVGAYNDSNAASNAGSAYVFRFNGVEWAEEAMVTADVPATGRQFGFAVDVSGEVIAVGQPRDDFGSVSMFRYDGLTPWAPDGVVKASDGQNGDELGTSVAIDGNRIVAGARLNDDLGTSSGSAYVFRFQTGVGWGEEAILLASDGGVADNNGQSVSIGGGRVVTGAFTAQIGTTRKGAAYVYDLPAIDPEPDPGVVYLQQTAFAGEDRPNTEPEGDMDLNDFVIEIAGCAETADIDDRQPRLSELTYVYNGRHVGAGSVANAFYHTVALAYDAANLPSITCAETVSGGTAIDPGTVRSVTPIEDRGFIQFPVYGDTRDPFDGLAGFIYTDPTVDVIPDENRITQCSLRFDVPVAADTTQLLGDPFLNRHGTGLLGGGAAGTAIEVHGYGAFITPAFTADADPAVTGFLANGAPNGVFIPRPDWQPPTERTNAVLAYTDLATDPDGSWYDNSTAGLVFEVDANGDPPPAFRYPDGSPCAVDGCETDEDCTEGEFCFYGECGSCSEGQALCDGACEDVLSDPDHCGACGNTCEAGHSCSEGVCQSPNLGSVLVFPYYTSGLDGLDTTITIENTATEDAIAHLFYVDRVSGQSADAMVIVPANDVHVADSAEFDPQITGFILVVAQDNQGCPRQFNFLRGELKVTPGTTATAIEGGLQAIPFAALRSDPASCVGANRATADLGFDGVSYTRAPRMLRIQGVPSPADLLSRAVVARLGGNLTTGAVCLNTLSGQLYDAKSDAYSYSRTPNGCAHLETLSDTFPATTPSFTTLLPSGTYGALDIRSENAGVVGGVFFSDPGGKAAGAADLVVLDYTEATLTIPVFAF